MSDYQDYESTSEDGFAPAMSPAEDPPVIAKMPDLDGNLYSGDSDCPSIETEQSVRSLSMPKMVMALIVAAVVPIGGWIIFGGGSDADQTARESYQPAPPAASAPEAPHWNRDAESKTAVIKLDEILPRRASGETLPAAFEDNTFKRPGVYQTVENAVEAVAKTPAADILPRVATNRSLTIGTPVPPAKTLTSKQDWSSLNEAEYYWAVRRHSEATTNARSVQRGDDTLSNYRPYSAVRYDLAAQKDNGVSNRRYHTANRPLSGYRDSDLAARQADNNVLNNEAKAQSHGAARLDGVIENPTVRMY